MTNHTPRPSSRWTPGTFFALAVVILPLLALLIPLCVFLTRLAAGL